MSTAVNTMHEFFNTLEKYSNDANADEQVMLSDAVRTVTHFAGLQDAINNFVSDVTNATAYSDVNARLQATCGIVLGADKDYTVDTGAVTGYNAGGITVKDAQSIVPETANLDAVSLPTAGSTTTHTYTGDDGKTFVFYVKWPKSFTSFYDLNSITSKETLQNMSDEELETYYVDASNFSTYTDAEDTTVTGEQMVSGESTIIKGLYNFWLSEGLKLAYDSFGVDFNGKTIEIRFIGGGVLSNLQAVTGPDEETTVPTDNIDMAINLPLYAAIDATDPNGNTRIDGGANQCYFDRTIAHELIHAVMFGEGTLKDNTPEFFSEGVAELVHGLDDYDGQNTALINGLANSSESLAGAMSLEPGTGTASRYTSGYMFLRYLSQQSLNTSIQVGNSSEAVNFNYAGNEAIISNYKSSDKITYTTDYTGLTLSGDDLILNSSSGSAYIRDCRDQLINVADGAGSITAYGYMASSGGELDGSNYDKVEVIIGGNDASNIITAGSGGSSLWGGAGGADTLIGGNGVDEFFYTTGGGADVIQNAGVNDIVNLIGMSLEQISSATVTDNGVNATFTDGGTLQISGQAGSFVVGGQTYHADYQNKTWAD